MGRIRVCFGNKKRDGRFDVSHPFVCSASIEEDQPILAMTEMTFSSSAFA
jgi:hypothetical protein